MKTNKFLVFALLLVSFALQAETYYKRVVSGKETNWEKVTLEEVNKNKPSRHSFCEAIERVYINGVPCSVDCNNSQYASCPDENPILVRDSNTWVTSNFTSPAPEAKANIIGGNPNTWAPQNEKPLLGRDPKTWTPATSSAPRANPNIGGDKNTWAPSGEPTYQDSTGLLGRSSNTYAPTSTKNAIIG